MLFYYSYALFSALQLCTIVFCILCTVCFYVQCVSYLPELYLGKAKDKFPLRWTFKPISSNLIRKCFYLGEVQVKRCMRAHCVLLDTGPPPSGTSVSLLCTEKYVNWIQTLIKGKYKNSQILQTWSDGVMNIYPLSPFTPLQQLPVCHLFCAGTYLSGASLFCRWMNP